MRTTEEVRAGVRELCGGFGPDYWREHDQAREYPAEFVRALTEAGYLAALIPERYGGLGLGITEAAAILAEINRSGGSASACHAQMYTMGALLRHGSDEQKQRYLPDIAAGRLTLQAFSVTEPDAGSDTTDIRTTARPVRDGYLITGHKNWTSRIEQSDLLLLLARTSLRPDEVARRAEGISLFLVDLREIRASAPETLRTEPVRVMFNYPTYQVWYRDTPIPADSLIGAEGNGFRYVIDGWNAERILLAAEAIGDGHWFIEQASGYASRREVFGRPIGALQGVQFPIVKAYAHIRAAELMCDRAAGLFDRNESCGAEANLAKYLASEASFEAANACLDAFGGYGFVDSYHVERKFRETRLFQTAPVSNNLVLAYLGAKVLGMPRSY